MKRIILSTVTALGITGMALADEAKGPTVMTDAQMDRVVAGSIIVEVCIPECGSGPVFAVGDAAGEGIVTAVIGGANFTGDVPLNIIGPD